MPTTDIFTDKHTCCGRRSEKNSARQNLRMIGMHPQRMRADICTTTSVAYTALLALAVITMHTTTRQLTTTAVQNGALELDSARD